MLKYAIKQKGISMGKYLHEAIAKSKRLIESDSSLQPFSEIYPWTNENISAYLNLPSVDINSKHNALSVLSGGDHLFNLIISGIKEIDTFDINEITKYYSLGLKRAMILKYEYDKFKSEMSRLWNANGDELYELIRQSYTDMDQEYKAFWEALIEFDNKYKKNNPSKYNFIHALSTIGDINIPGMHVTHSGEYDDNFLTEENYNILRTLLPSATINFERCNAFELYSRFKRFSKQYDLILLSNIFDYFWYYRLCQGSKSSDWSYSLLKEYEEKLAPLTRENTIAFLHYAFYAQINRGFIFDKSSIKRTDLGDEEIYNIPSKESSSQKDAVLVKKYTRKK